MSELGDHVTKGAGALGLLYPHHRKSAPLFDTSASCQRRTHARQKSHLVAALVQAGALLINHIAPGNRTLAPSA